MQYKKAAGILGQLVLSALSAMLLATAADIAVYLAGGFLRGKLFLLIFAGLTIGIWCLCFFCRKTKTVSKLFLWMMAVIVLLYSGWLIFRNWGNYEAVDSGKDAFYENHRVMLIVPHQDDEINVLGGVIEEYVTYGSEVFIVFATNGDNFYPASTRLREAIAAAACMGVPEDHLIFLGYGDGWRSGDPHIYNAEPGEIQESYCGRTATYGLEDHPAYHDGNPYTSENYLNDMRSVILDHRPDVIFCVDYDSHADHRATSLFFEKAMGILLKENPDYRPTVYKGYGYNTAWGAVWDYCAMNVGATAEVTTYPFVYRWEDRIRLPVSAEGLSRSLSGSNVFQALAAHACQDAETHAAAVANGDKAVWYRNTNSLCYDAVIDVSSGDGTLLNNFMVYDNLNLSKEPNRIDGVWIPEEADTEKSFTVTLSQPRQVDYITLYDHPYEDHNILNAVIELDNGTCMETGPLNPGGAVNTYQIGAEVQSFSVTILEWEGDLAGLGEVEAFPKTTNNAGFLKMVDTDGNFAYDYILDVSGTEAFCFYTYGELPNMDAEHYTVSCTNDSCEVILGDGVLTVHCPRSQTASITVTCNDVPVSDTIYVRNPRTVTRIWANAFQRLEDAYFFCAHKNSPLYQAGFMVVTKLSELF